MALKTVITYPHKVLREHARPVTEFNKKIQALIDDMAETMYDAPGIGLAANQVGELDRVIVLDTTSEEEKSKLIALVNPAIIASEGTAAIEEGCLSVVDFRTEIPRAEKITVRALDLTGRRIELHADGILAIALQHEIDHLNGILIVDHVSSLKRQLYKQSLRKKQRKGS